MTWGQEMYEVPGSRLGERLHVEARAENRSSEDVPGYLEFFGLSCVVYRYNCFTHPYKRGLK